jgi:alkylation response protein AidB-like acyl-CoA dehydrogenase
MDAPGVTLRPIQLIDGEFEVNEVFFEDVRVPGDMLVGEENAGWSYAKFLLGNERVGVAPVAATKRALALAKEHARETGALADPLVAARIVELENELLALDLTALRVVANSADGKPHPASSVLKMKGTELQQAVSELALDLGGELALATGSETAPEWAVHAGSTYLNLRKASIYGGSNEIQRQIIAGTILGL